MAPAPPVTVVLADVAGIAREALALVIASTPGLSLAGVAATQDELRATVAETRPDVVVVDDRLLRAGTAGVAELGARLVVTGVDDDPAYAVRASRIGGVWVRKDVVEDLLAALSRNEPEARVAEPAVAAPAPR